MLPLARCIRCLHISTVKLHQVQCNLLDADWYCSIGVDLMEATPDFMYLFPITHHREVNNSAAIRNLVYLLGSLHGTLLTFDSWSMG